MEWDMKRCPLASQVLSLVIFGAAACAPAQAQLYWSGSGQSANVYYSRHDGVRVAISLGVPLYAPRYYASPNYFYPAYTYPAPVYSYPAPVYSYPTPAYSYPAPAYSYSSPGYANAPQPPVVQRQQSEIEGPMASPKPQADRYFCAESDAYYPNVTSCADGWQRMSAQRPMSS